MDKKNLMISCSCGKCNLLIPKYDNRGRERKYIQGHQFKEIPKTKEHKNKLSEIRKKNIKDGKIKIWCSGLTTETDIRLKNSIIKGSKTRKGKPNLKQSETMRRLYAEGKIIHPMLNKPRSEETRLKISLSHLGKKKPKLSETRKKLFAEGKLISPMKGKHHTQETKLKERLSHLGNHPTTETRLKMGLARKGKKQKVEWSKKIGLANKGKHYSIKTEFKKGKNHPYFNNYSSFEPYTLDFNKQFKKVIKERDGYCCQLCHIGIEDLHQLNRRLCVHHINYDKRLSIKENCITLCNKCHTMTNHNRKHWIQFFQDLLQERYNYQFNEEQNIIINYNKEMN